MVCMHRHTVHCAYVLSVSLGSDSSVWSVQAIAILLKEFFDIKISMSFLYKFLHYTMGFSSKAATKHNPTRNLMLIRRLVEKRYREIVIQALREIIVFLDEVHIASDRRCCDMASKEMCPIFACAGCRTLSSHNFYWAFRVLRSDDDCRVT